MLGQGGGADTLPAALTSNPRKNLALAVNSAGGNFLASSEPAASRGDRQQSPASCSADFCWLRRRQRVRRWPLTATASEKAETAHGVTSKTAPSLPSLGSALAGTSAQAHSSSVAWTRELIKLMMGQQR